MAIAVNAQTSLDSQANESSWSLSHTCAGSDRLLLVFVSVMRGGSGGIGVSSCTFNGQNMTQAITRGWNDTNRTRSYRESIYYMVAPTTSAANVAVTTDQLSTATVITAISLTGVHQSSPAGNVNSGDLTSSTVSLDVTTTAANSWLFGGGMMRNGNRTFSPGANVVERFETSTGTDTDTDITAFGGYKTVASAGSATINWTANGAGFGVYCAVEVKAATAASQEIAPSGLAVGVGKGSVTVWNHRIVAAVGTGNDDGREASTGTVTLNLTSHLVNASTPVVAMVVRALAMPTADARVTAAKVQLNMAGGAGSDDTRLTLRGQAAPGSLTTTNYDLSGRTKTTNGVAWSEDNIGASGWRDSPDIRTVVQEAIDDEDWAATRDLALFLIDNGAGGVTQFTSFEQGNPPRVVIDWAFGGITPEGKAVGVGIGTAVVGRGAVSVSPAGKAVGVALGAPAVGRGAVSVAPAGKAVGVALGAPAVGRGTVSVAPAGKGVGVGFGTAAVGRGAVSIAPAGKAVGAAAGTAVVGRGAVNVAPAGKAVGATAGTAVVGRGAVNVAPAGKAVGAAAGTAVVGRGTVNVAPAGKAVGATIGSAIVGTGAPTIAPAGLAVGAAAGTATVGRGAVSVAPSGLAVGVGKGAATIGRRVAPAGLAVGAAFGTAAVGRGAVSIAPAGKGVAVAIGAATVGTGAQMVAPAGLAVAAAIGAAVVVGPQSVAPSGLAVGIGKGAPGVVLRGIGLYGVTTTSSSTSASEWSLSATSGGVHRYAVVIAHVMRDVANANFEVMAVYGGATMVPLVLWTYPDTPRTRTYGVLIFGLIAPPVGAQTVTVTLEEGHTAVAAGVTVLALANVSQTTPTMRTGGGDVIGSATASARVYDGLVGSWLVGGATMRGGDLTFTPGGGMTEVYDLPSGSSTTDDLTATGGYLPLLVAAPYRDWIATSNALDYGVVAAVEVRPAMVVYAAGLGVGVGIGGAAVRNLANVRPAGLAVAVGIGAPGVGAAGTLVGPSGLAVAAALGAAALEAGGVVVAPAGQAVALAIGAPALVSQVAVEGLAVALAIGDGALAGSSATVAPGGLAAGVAAGTARLWMHRVAAAVVADGYETPAGAVFLGTTSLNVEVSQPWVGVMTDALDVPAAATIVDARLLLTTITHDDPQLEAACELDASPATLTTAAGNISGRSLTAARARWEAANVGLGAVQSPNLGAVVQEVVGLPEWEPGARLLFVWRDLGTGGWLRWYSADAAAQYRPSVQIDWQFGAADLDLVPAGLGLAVTAGEHLVAAGGVEIAPAGQGVAVAGGAPAVGRGAVVVLAGGLAVGVAFGAPAVEGGLLVVEVEGLAVAVALGEALVGAAVRPAGLVVVAAAGAHLVMRGGMGIAPAGVAVGLALGAPAVGRGVLVIAPAGQGVAVAVGATVVGRGGLEIAPAGRAVAVALGAPAVGQVARPAGWAVVVALGAPAVGQVARPAGWAVAVALGGPAVGRGAATVAPAGEAVAAAAGAHVVMRGGTGIAPAGLGVGVGSGTPAVARRLEFVRPGGLALGALFGAAMVALARQPWSLTVRARGNGLTVAARGHGLTLRPRDNELTVEDRVE